MPKQFLVSILFILTFNIYSYAQKSFTISGFVYDSLSGEKIIGANIICYEKNVGTVTNSYGYYSISIQTDKPMQLSYSFIGFKNITKTVEGINQRIDVYLSEGLYIDEVEIKTNKENISQRSEMSVIHIPIKQIESLPTLFGEVDIMKSLQLMPGIQSGGEGKTYLNVRGGSNDQNLILLDNMPLYYVCHFGGFFSTFNSDAINDIKLYKGGFPAKYGGRISSILDVRMKDGNLNEFHGSGTLGLLSSKLLLEGPVKKGKSSFLISARSNIIPLFTILSDGRINYNFYDINAKFNSKLTEKDRIFISYYMGDDNVKVKNKEKTTTSGYLNLNSNKWGNMTTSVYWNHVYNLKLFSNLTVGVTKYRYINAFKQEISVDSINQEVNNRMFSSITDIVSKIDYEYFPADNFKIKFGINFLYHTFNPGQVDYKQDGTFINKVDTSYNNIKINAFEFSFYSENELKVGKWFTTNTGFFYSNYLVDEKIYYSFEPRILLNFIITSKFSIKSAYSNMHQYVHLINYSGVGMPTDFWLPSNNKVKPEHSDQYAIGIAWQIFKNKIEFSIEYYYKTLNNLIAFKQGESFFNVNNSWEEKIITNGKGIAEGLEFLLQKKEGKSTGWIGFTISHSNRTFQELNEGKVFPFNYDRTYDIGSAFIHKLNDMVSFSLTWTYGSGYPVTLPTKKYDSFGDEIYVFDEINSFRMKDYHRFDIGINFNKKLKWAERTLNFSILNVYNRKNPYYYYFENDDLIISSNNGMGAKVVDGDLKLYQQSFFPFLPSFSYSLKF